MKRDNSFMIENEKETNCLFFWVKRINGVTEILI